MKHSSLNSSLLDVLGVTRLPLVQMAQESTLLKVISTQLPIVLCNICFLQENEGGKGTKLLLYASLRGGGDHIIIIFRMINGV